MTGRRTIRDFTKGADRPYVCLTAYTAPVARIADKHADLLLVGDSLGMVLYGFPSTLQVTLDMMILHGAAVVRSSARALVIVDMPFGSYQESPEQAFRSAARIMAETGCTGVKLEGGSEMAETVEFLTRRGIPVMGHIGLQPQSVHGAGGYRVMGRSDSERARILAAARALSAAGIFAIVLECVTPDLAAAVTEQTAVPVIGIGASAACDGQVLVTDDLLKFTESQPKFVKIYADMGQGVDAALERFAADVRARRFPAPENIYKKTKESIGDVVG